MMVIVLYAQIIGCFVLYFNYDISIRNREEIAQHATFLRLKKTKQIIQNNKKEKSPRYIRRRDRQNTKDIASKEFKVQQTMSDQTVNEMRHSENTVKRPRRNIRRIPPKDLQTIEPSFKEQLPIPTTETVKAQQAKTNKPALRCPPPVERKVTFNEAEYAPFDGSGLAVISGSLCFPLKDGSTKCFENTDVFINPVTSYSDEWYIRGWAGRENLQRADERAFKYNKMVKTGKDGTFKFENLKPGSYYVAAAVCLPEAKDAKNCQRQRYAAKVSMKRLVKPTFKRVFP